ncbi:hypothetical protein, partial [Acidaminococcus timonensis]|uniref:hypothetical protein n=1 Tax=Acidaminococcus timonensis TaxID=1871002 RepID=UPI00307975BA
ELPVKTERASQLRCSFFVSGQGSATITVLRQSGNDLFLCKILQSYAYFTAGKLFYLIICFFFSEIIDTVLIIQFVFSPCDLKTTVHDEFK